MLRVSFMDEAGHENLVPGINSFAPPILVATDGKPAYGQVMLAEVIGGFFVIMAVLYAKREIGNGADPALWVATIGIAFYVSSDIFRDISGGFINPATALAQNIWQNITVKLDPNHEWAMWTFEYTICYLLGPLIGGFVGGTVFNYVTETMENMEDFGDEDEVDPDQMEKDLLKRKMTGDTQQSQVSE